MQLQFHGLGRFERGVVRQVQVTEFGQIVELTRLQMRYKVVTKIKTLKVWHLVE